MYKQKKRKSQVRSQGCTYTSLVESRSNNQQNRKLRILFFHNTLPEYRIGWFQNLSELADVEYVFTNEGLNKKDYGFDIDYERTCGLKFAFLKKGPEGIRRLKEILADVEQYDFVELPPIDSMRDAIFGRYIVKICKKYNVKMGYFWEKWEAPTTMQPIMRKFKNLILRIVPKSIYKCSDILFAVGRKSKDYFLVNGMNEDKIFIVPDVSETPPCEYVAIKSKYSIPSEKKIIMYLGRILPQKGVGCLIKAFHMLPLEIKENSHLLIAGDGCDKAACEKLAKDLEIDNVTFTGAIEPYSRGNYFAQCDIFTYPVTYYAGWVDVWGLTLNEAVQHGKFIVATDAVGSAYELIEDGVNGYRVEPGNVQALSDSLKKAMNKEMMDTATKKDADLMKVYNFHVMAEKYIESIKKFVK